jgi:hypothetical protein
VREETAVTISAKHMARWLRFDIVGCVACRKDGLVNRQYEHHHLNFNGKAGQKRLGHDFTIPLCGWHHVGRPPEGHDSKWAETNLGPSLAKQSKKFREKYGSDQHLLDYTNALITESYGF